MVPEVPPESDLPASVVGTLNYSEVRYLDGFRGCGDREAVRGSNFPDADVADVVGGADDHVWVGADGVAATYLNCSVAAYVRHPAGIICRAARGQDDAVIGAAAHAAGHDVAALHVELVDGRRRPDANVRSVVIDERGASKAV